jgi:hypothetical protein
VSAYDEHEQHDDYAFGDGQEDADLQRAARFPNDPAYMDGFNSRTAELAPR